MKNKKVNPPVGGYFKHRGRVYKAVSSNGYSCAGCCFYEQSNTGAHHCESPVDIDCSFRVMKDVTGSKELNNVELIDAPVEKRSFKPVLIFLLVFWSIVAALIF